MAGWWRKRWPRMLGFDLGFVPQLLCAADSTTAGISGALCVLVVSLAVGLGLWQARDSRRRSVGRFLCLGAVSGLIAHAAIVVVLRLS